MTFKLKALMSVFATITLLTAPAVKSDEFTRIATKQQYQKLAVGKRWYLGEGYAIARRNGRRAGEFGGEELQETWAWRGDL